jgi:hypothetical protein
LRTFCGHCWRNSFSSAGAVTSLLVTDKGTGPPRTTLDVDAIAEITSYAEYATFGERLRSLGFTEDASDGAPSAAGSKKQQSLM